MGTLSRATRTASLVFARNPLIRPADRAVSAVYWVIVLIALAVVPVAASVGSVVHAQRAESAQAEQHARHQVRATLREDAPAAVDYTGAATKGTAVHAWWQTEDGRLHTGDTTSIWADQTGAATGPPRTVTSAVGDGVVVVLAILSAAGILLGGLYWLARAIVRQGARRAWARQWRDVEPRWTGRIGREPA